jgi:hypothetical protein
MRTLQPLTLALRPTSAKADIAELRIKDSLGTTTSEPAARMRLLQAVVLLTFGILLPSLVQADAVTFITTIGADFQPDSGLVAGLSGGLSLIGFSDSGGHFVFSNPLPLWLD